MRIWKTIKRDILFAEEMTDKELFKLLLMCAAATPIVIVFTWLMFGAAYALQ